MTTPFVLDATTKTIQAVMSGAATTTNPSFTAAWGDDTGSAFTEGSSDGAFNGATPVTIVAAPAAATRRVIKNITIANIDTAPVTITLSYNDNSTLRTVVKVTLQVGDTWTTEGTYDTNGNLKTSLTNQTITLSGIVTGTGSSAITTSFGTFSSATLAAALTDETGTGVVVYSNTPTLVTPVIGAATGTSLNLTGLTISSAVATDASKNLVSVTNTGTGNNVLATSPTLVTPTLGAALATSINGNILTTGSSTYTGTAAATYTFPGSSATIAGLATTQTLTNKRITRRVVVTTQSATPAINSDNTDMASITGLAQAITSMTTNLTGTPVQGDFLEIQITDNGTARAITWGASFVSSTITLPTTTVISTLLHVLFEWDATLKWVCVGVA